MLNQRHGLLRFLDNSWIDLDTKSVGRVTRPAALRRVRALLADWFEDYNTFHPHSGLRFLSPREFIQQQSVHQAICPV